MIIHANLQAMNNNRMLGLNQSKKAKSTEKLSSGYRINRSADDSSGLSISEKMRRQIRGLTQAVSNAQEGISFCQIADGALHEVNEMLSRSKELVIQAANGTNTEEDRSYIQSELDELSREIDRVHTTTVFNEMSIFSSYGIIPQNMRAPLESGVSLSNGNEIRIQCGLVDSQGIFSKPFDREVMKRLTS